MSGARLEREREPATELETARYIADIASGMSVMARSSGLEVLAYLLDLVRLEAEEIAQNCKPGPPPRAQG